MTINNSDAEDSSSVEKVMRVILEGIRGGKYRSGDKVIARDLAKDLNLSRAPVREAIHILAGQGVLELPPRRSARVRKLSVTDIFNIADLLKVIAGLTVRRAAQRIAIEDNKERVSAAMAKVRAVGKSGDGLRLLLSINDYMLELANITENPYIHLAFESMHFENFHRAMIEEVDIPGEFKDTFVEDMEKITEAVLAGRSTKAEQLYYDHLEWILPIMRTRLRTDSSSQPWFRPRK